MPQLRLIGLVLMITTVFLALAAATTQTTHIRFKKPDQTATSPDGEAVSPVEFGSVPIVWPLLFSGLLGSLMWFTPAPRSTTSAKRRRGRTKRKR